LISGGDIFVSGVTMVSVKDAVALCAGVPESVTVNVSGVAVTAANGVPLISPVAGFNVKPAGIIQAVNCQVLAPTPPVAVSVCEYATPALPLLSAVVVIVSTELVDVIVMVAKALCGGTPESVTLNVRLAVPAADGVPLITPVAAFNVKPDGRIPETDCHV
jgi:hypothetical protein